jgi:hypothetical protein
MKTMRRYFALSGAVIAAALTSACLSWLGPDSACVRGDCRSGYGEYEWYAGERAGDRYSGEWRAGLMDGKGTYFFRDLDAEFRGTFRSGRRHGDDGLTLFRNALRLVADYRNGEACGELRVEHPEGRSERIAAPPCVDQ